MKHSVAKTEIVSLGTINRFYVTKEKKNVKLNLDYQVPYLTSKKLKDKRC